MSGTKRVFVTGATGFLGYALALELVDDGHTVTALTRSGDLPGELEARGVRKMRGDLGDVRTLGHAMRGCQWVFHVAADVNMWRDRWADSVRNNVTGTKNMVEAALEAGVDRFVAHLERGDHR